MTDRIAKVEDLDALKALKRALWKFQETANTALVDAESEMSRAMMWLETEQLQHWQSQIRKRSDIVERCKEAVRMKKLFKDATGRMQSAVDEEKALKIAIRNLDEAEQKLVNVKKHTAKLRREIMMYKGHVQRFATSVQSDLPHAAAQLDSLLDTLRQYVALDLSHEVKSSAPQESDSAASPGHGSMSRPADDAPDAEPPAEEKDPAPPNPS